MHELHLNKHGVQGVYETTGRYGYHDRETGRWIGNLPVFVPETCLDCEHYDRGETGDRQRSSSRDPVGL